jgi:hypothetical protein
MPKSLASREINTFFEQPKTEAKEQKSSFSVKLAKVVGGAALGTMGFMVVGNIAQASADNNLIFGGRAPGGQGDVNTSQQYADWLLKTGQIKPTDNNFAVPYSAGIAEQLDNVSMRDSVNEANTNAQDILNTKINRNQPTKTFGYSEGSAPAIEVARNNPHLVTHVTIDKSPYGPHGLSSSPVANDPGIRSMLEQNEVIINEQLPQVPITVNAEAGDVFSAGGPLADLNAIIEQFQSTFNGPHDMSDPGEPHRTEHYGLVTFNWYGDEPLPRATIDLPPMPNLLAPADAQPAPDAAPAPADVPPAPEAAPVFLASETAPAPEAAPAPAPEVVPDQAPAPEAPAPDAPAAPDMDLAPAA